MADQEQQRQSVAVATPELPKGGGAIQGINKGFGAVSASGAASFDIALPVSGGRGLAPQLGLSYTSATGNGPFGMGWQLTLGAITRRTSKGVPRYDDSDVMLGPGGETLMPGLAADDVRHTSKYRGLALGATYSVARYYPRTEGAFTLIERWRVTADDPGFWLLHGADGSLACYGKRDSARIVDPDNVSHVAQWLVEEIANPFGEHILYEYKAEDHAGLPDDEPRNFRAQRYIERVLYGNVQAHEPLYLWNDEPPKDDQWHFHLLFDYGENTGERPQYPGQGAWTVRSDRHSTYAFGFELGSARLCRHVAMYHQFPELGAQPVLTRWLSLDYPEHPLGYAILRQATLHAVNPDQSQSADWPSLSFSYNPFETTQGAFTPFERMPGLNDGQRYQLVDLFGDGLPGVLYRAEKGWLYREPVRDLSAENDPDAVSYGPWALLPQLPVADTESPVRQLLADMTGDGRPDWVVAFPGMSGFFTLNPDGQWSGFVPFAAFPTEFMHPEGQWVDLVGAGLTDLAMIGPRSVRLYASQREKGFEPPREVAHDPDRLPIPSDSRSELVAFSDLLGSGQQHLVRIRHDEIRIWPNLGHGRFGAGFRFASLDFDYATFDASRVCLADLDGSGAVDLLYLQPDQVRIYLNRGGAGLAAPFDQPWPDGVRYDRLCQVSIADLRGLGCASLVLTVPHMQPRHWRLDFAPAKPYLLRGNSNGMGASGHIDYRSSAQEWLDEKHALRAAGKPAVSGLPFPLHVVSRQTQLDEVTGNQLTQTFNYRDGYYDGKERQFEGFGQIQQLDTEPGRSGEDGFTAAVLTKTWYHNGRPRPLAGDDFFQGDLGAVALGPDLLTVRNGEMDEPVDQPSEAMLEEMAQALSGAVRRVEVYGLEDTEPARVPYSVQASRYLVRQLEPLGPQRPYARTLPLTLEGIAWHYEGHVDDPQCQHDITLAWDGYGQVTHAATVNYARRPTEHSPPPFDEEHQQQWWRAAHDEAQQRYYFNEARAQYIHLDDPEGWRLGLPYRARGNAMMLEASELQPEAIGYEAFLDPEGAFAGLPRTLVSLVLQRYQRCGDGEAEFIALPDAVESAELDEHAMSAYDRVMTRDELAVRLAELGYHRMPSFLGSEKDLMLWSVKRGFNTHLGAEGFYRIERFKPTASHGETLVEYDPYHLFVTKVTAPDGCTTEAFYDYDSLQPWRIVDPNRNTQEVRYDLFGAVHLTSFYGTELGEPVGFDSIENYREMPRDIETALHVPLSHDCATECLYERHWDGKEPPRSVVFQWDRYPGDELRQRRMTLASCDGFGRPLQTRQLVEDGDAYQTVVADDGHTDLAVEEGKPVTTDASPRWRVSERVEYNNKGLAVRVYRPYFADSHLYIRDASMRDAWYHDKQFYDPLGRPTVTWTAKGWMRRMTYHAWYSISEDENDTQEEVEAMRAVAASASR